MKTLLRTCLAAVALLALAASAQAKTTLVWWDFLSGGDGVRMKAMIQKFNAENPDIEIDPTTLNGARRSTPRCRPRRRSARGRTS